MSIAVHVLSDYERPCKGPEYIASTEQAGRYSYFCFYVLLSFFLFLSGYYEMLVHFVYFLANLDKRRTLFNTRQPF